MSTSGGRLPRSTRSTDPKLLISSVSQRLPGLQRVLNALERLALPAQLQKRFALEIEQIQFADRRLVRQRAAGNHVCERAADRRVVIADASGAPGEMHAKLQRGEHAVAADG